jgi:hypothetical protein
MLSSRQTKKGETDEEKVKIMLIIFFDIKGIVHKEFVLAGHTVNFAHYCDVSQRLRENVRRLRHELWRKKTGLLHQDNATPHTYFFHQVTVYQKQYDCRPLLILLA